MSEWVTLEELRPGAVFVTRNGVYAVKSEYYNDGPQPRPQCQCILLESGEYAWFKDGNRTLVQEVEIEKGR